MNNKRFLVSLTGALVSLFAINSCAVETDISQSHLFDSAQNVSTLSKGNNLNRELSPDVQVFVGKVSKLGVKLSDEQIEKISIQRNARPSGNFASRPAHNLSAEQNLDIHFKKHYKEFKGITNKNEYLNRAISFLNNDSPSANYYFDSTSFAKDYQSNVVKYDSVTHELSAVRNNGDITTYYTSDALSSKRFVMLPKTFNY